MPPQIPRVEEFTFPAAQALFGSSLLTLYWIKGEPLPDGLVDEILRALGLERETVEKRHRRSDPVRNVTYHRDKADI